MKTPWQKTMNKDYLGSWDIDDGQTLNVVIERIEIRDVPDASGKKQKCNVAILKGTKPMILNVTACKQIQKFQNSKYIEDWVNVPITLYVDKVKAFGDVVEALRISDKQPIKPVMKKGDKSWDKAVEYLKANGIEKLSSITDKYVVDAEELVKCSTT